MEEGRVKEVDDCVVQAFSTCQPGLPFKDNYAIQRKQYDEKDPTTAGKDNTKRKSLTQLNKNDLMVEDR